MSVRQQTVIQRLRVKNYRSLVDVDLTFDRIMVLVGANGSGKSNLIDVLKFVRDVMVRDLDDAIVARGGIASLRRWSSKGAPDLSIQIDLIDPYWKGEYGFTIGSGRNGDWRVKSESMKIVPTESADSIFDTYTPVSYQVKEGKIIGNIVGLGYFGDNLKLIGSNSILLIKTINILKISDAVGEIYKLLSDMSFYTIYPDHLRDPQKPGNDYPLDERGQNLASVLRRIQRKPHQDVHNTLVYALGRVVDGVTGYSVRQLGNVLVTQLHHAAAEEGRSGPAFDLSQESDGTLRMLGILTAIYQNPPRSLLVIEEPELTIHPGALGVLCDVLKEAGARSQLVITTHSPDLIDIFPEYVLRVVEKRDGVTYVGPVSSQQREVIARKLFSPGELLRMEGLQLGSDLSTGR
ncbi:MAG: AAA family ATPase [Roseiflexaceae bacterium]